MKQSLRMPSLKRVLFLLSLIFILGSCTSTLYHRNWHQLNIPKAETYQVSYVTEIPDATEGKITYSDKDGNVVLEHVTGKWTKEAILPSGKKGVFNVRISSPKSVPEKELVTSLIVNGQTITKESQTGRNIWFHMAFELP